MAGNDDVKEVVRLSRPQPQITHSIPSPFKKWIFHLWCTVHLTNNQDLYVTFTYKYGTVAIGDSTVLLSFEYFTIKIIGIYPLGDRQLLQMTSV